MKLVFAFLSLVYGDFWWNVGFYGLPGFSGFFGFCHSGNLVYFRFSTLFILVLVLAFLLFSDLMVLLGRWPFLPFLSVY
jgi:hypothetical protein